MSSHTSQEASAVKATGSPAGQSAGSPACTPSGKVQSIRGGSPESPGFSQ